MPDVLFTAPSAESSVLGCDTELRVQLVNSHLEFRMVHDGQEFTLDVGVVLMPGDADRLIAALNRYAGNSPAKPLPEQEDRALARRLRQWATELDGGSQGRPAVPAAYLEDVQAPVEVLAKQPALRAEQVHPPESEAS